jgi:adenosine deaminase
MKNMLGAGECMGWYGPLSKDNIFLRLPKVELHRHLEGTLRLGTMLEIAREHDIPLPVADDQLHSLVQMQTSDALNSIVFLSKFQILRQFYKTPEIITRVTREAIADARADGVRYMELRFTPLALSRVQGFPMADVMDWVCESAAEASQTYDLPTRLIVSVNRHESVDVAAQVADLALQRMDRGIVALDLAGNEVDYNALPFLEIFTAARSGGLHTTIHAGEWNGPQNVRQAVEVFHADRIGHGVRVVEDPEIVALARDYQTAFEVCLTSNVQTGVVQSLNKHPMRSMLEQGLHISLNTDDPGISQIVLSDEYRVAVEELGLSQLKLEELILSAAQAAFLSPSERDELVRFLKDEISTAHS